MLQHVTVQHSFDCLLLVSLKASNFLSFGRDAHILKRYSLFNTNPIAWYYNLFQSIRHLSLWKGCTHFKAQQFDSTQFSLLGTTISLKASSSSSFGKDARLKAQQFVSTQFPLLGTVISLKAR